MTAHPFCAELDGCQRVLDFVREPPRHVSPCGHALRPDERLAVIGRFFLGLTDEEAAAALGVRRGAVKMRVFRALERLRVELEGPA